MAAHDLLDQRDRIYVEFRRADQVLIEIADQLDFGFGIDRLLRRKILIVDFHSNFTAAVGEQILFVADALDKVAAQRRVLIVLSLGEQFLDGDRSGGGAGVLGLRQRDATGNGSDSKQADGFFDVHGDLLSERICPARIGHESLEQSGIKTNLRDRMPPSSPAPSLPNCAQCEGNVLSLPRTGIKRGCQTEIGAGLPV